MYELSEIDQERKEECSTPGTVNGEEGERRSFFDVVVTLCSLMLGLPLAVVQRINEVDS